MKSCIVCGKQLVNERVDKMELVDYCEKLSESKLTDTQKIMINCIGESLKNENRLSVIYPMRSGRTYIMQIIHSAYKEMERDKNETSNV